MTDPIKALVAYQRRRERDEADKRSIALGGKLGPAILESDLARFREGRLAHQITTARALIEAAIIQTGAQRPYVAFSGGKDSICALAIASTVDPLIPAVWSDDELEYPDVVSYMRAMAHVAASDRQHFVWLQGGGQHRWFRPWQDPPYWREPDSRMIWRAPHQRDTRDWARDEGYDLVILGTRMQESRRRRARLGSEHAGGVVARPPGGIPECTPLWDWTEADVWALIAGWNLPYPVLYDKLAAAGIERHRQPLAPREVLEALGLYHDLVARYGERW